MDKELEQHIKTTSRLKKDSAKSNPCSGAVVDIEWLGLETGRLYKERLNLMNANLGGVKVVDNFGNIDEIAFISDRTVILSISKERNVLKNIKDYIKKENNNTAENNSIYYTIPDKNEFLRTIESDPVSTLCKTAINIYGEELGKEFKESLDKKINASKLPLINFSEIEKNYLYNELL